MARARALLVLGVVLCGALAAPATAADGRFLSVISDLPLMPGLAEAPGSAVVFSKPSGRIVEVAASGRLKRAAVLAFYRRTLPQLGWRAAGPRAFRREGERLSLDFAGGDGRLVVRFSLVPE